MFNNFGKTDMNSLIGITMWEIWTGGDMPYGRMRNPEVVGEGVSPALQAQQASGLPQCGLRSHEGLLAIGGSTFLSSCCVILLFKFKVVWGQISKRAFLNILLANESSIHIEMYHPSN